MVNATNYHEWQTQTSKASSQTEALINMMRKKDVKKDAKKRCELKRRKKKMRKKRRKKRRIKAPQAHHHHCKQLRNYEAI